MNDNVNLLEAVFEFFDWMYEVEIRPNQRRDIEQQIRVGWNNPDASERELLAYILELHDRIMQLEARHRVRLRGQAQRIFNREFAMQEQNDRSRVLAALQLAIESLRPGVTETPLPKVTTRATPTQAMYIPPASIARLQFMQSGQASHASVDPWTPTSNMPDMLRVQQEKMAEAERVALLATIRKMEHDSRMMIIQKF